MMVNGVKNQNGGPVQPAIRGRNLSGHQGQSLLNRLIIKRIQKLKFLKRLRSAHQDGEIVKKLLIGLLALIQTKRRDDLQILHFYKFIYFNF
jgi:hypothetical protein